MVAASVLGRQAGRERVKIMGRRRAQHVEDTQFLGFASHVVGNFIASKFHTLFILITHNWFHWRYTSMIRHYFLILEFISLKMSYFLFVYPQHNFLDQVMYNVLLSKFSCFLFKLYSIRYIPLTPYIILHVCTSHTQSSK